MDESLRRVAETVRTACLEAALHAYDDAGLSGLCQEGRWEVAIGAIRALDLDNVIRAALAAASQEAQEIVEERAAKG